MYSEFLNFNTTYSTKIRDFNEWHKGIKYFGFWAIEITNSDCKDQIQIAQKHLTNRLHTHYSRQPHITLATVGLLLDNSPQNTLITDQIEKIKKSNIKSFPLQLSSFNSFSTCPYLNILDPLQKLNSIRECLNIKSDRSTPSKYTPHVTLGFYNDRYQTLDIVKDISKKSFDDIEFTVKEIVFARYKTKDVQGPYEVLHRIKLNDL